MTPRIEHITRTTLAPIAVLVLLALSPGDARALTFAPPGVFQTGGQPKSVAIGDVTSDDRNDVLLSTGSYNDPANDRKLFLFAQAEDGSLEPAKKLDQTVAQDAYGGLVIGDLDGDGANDAAIGTASGIDVFYQENGTLASAVLLPGAPAPIGDLEVADVDGDAADDLVVSTSTGITALVQRAEGGFDTVPVSSQVAESIATGDLNGDELSDVVAVSNYDQPNALRIHEQLATGGYAERPIPLTFDEDPNKIAVADVTGDGYDDIVVTRGGNSPSAELGVYPQVDGSIDAPADVYDSYDIPEAVKTADIDGDGFEDVVVVHSGWSRVGIYLQDPDGYLYDEQLISSPYLLSDRDNLALGDITSDGLTDFAVAYYGGSLVVRRQRLPFSLTGAGHSDGRITASWTRPSGMKTEFIEVATSPEVYPAGRLAGLFVDEHIVLYDDSLARTQESYVAAEPLPPGTYYVHVRAWDDQICLMPDEPDCPSEVSTTSVVHVPPVAGAGAGAPRAADTVVSFKAVRIAARQPARKLRVTASMTEPGTITAGGTVSVPNSSRTYRLRSASANVGAGATATLRPGLSKKARRPVLRAIRRGSRVVARIVVTVRDRAGNKGTAKRTIRLTR